MVLVHLYAPFTLHLTNCMLYVKCKTATRPHSVGASIVGACKLDHCFKTRIKFELLVLNVNQSKLWSVSNLLIVFSQNLG
jgi:hypothetical protein